MYRRRFSLCTVFGIVSFFQRLVPEQLILYLDAVCDGPGLQLLDLSYGDFKLWSSCRQSCVVVLRRLCTRKRLETCTEQERNQAVRYNMMLQSLFSIHQ